MGGHLRPTEASGGLLATIVGRVAALGSLIIVIVALLTASVGARDQGAAVSNGANPGLIGSVPPFKAVAVFNCLECTVRVDQCPAVVPGTWAVVTPPAHGRATWQRVEIVQPAWCTGPDAPPETLPATTLYYEMYFGTPTDVGEEKFTLRYTTDDDTSYLLDVTLYIVWPYRVDGIFGPEPIDPGAPEISVSVYQDTRFTNGVKTSGKVRYTIYGEYSAYSFWVNNGNSIVEGDISESFDRHKVPVGHYEKLRIDFIPDNPAAFTFSQWVNMDQHLDVYGNVLHHTYTAPTESACGGQLEIAYVYGYPTCTFRAVELDGRFIRQMRIFGGGYSTYHGPLKYSRATSWCPNAPPHIRKDFAFRQVPKLTGSCETPGIGDNIVASYPPPLPYASRARAPDGNFKCGNIVSLYDGQSGALTAKKLLTDSCPRCAPSPGSPTRKMADYQYRYTCNAYEGGYLGTIWTQSTRRQ